MPAVRLYGSPYPVVAYSGATKGNRVDGVNKTTAANVPTNVGCYYTGGSKSYAWRTLLEYDLRSLIGVTVTAATWNIFVGTGSVSGAAGTIYRMSQTNWDANCTWNTYDGTNAWGASGGDIDQDPDYTTPSIAYTSPGAPGGLPAGNQYWWASPDLATLVQDALDSRSGVLSILIRIDNENPGSNNYFTWDGGLAASKEPYLEIQWTASPRGVGLDTPIVV